LYIHAYLNINEHVYVYVSPHIAAREPLAGRWSHKPALFLIVKDDGKCGRVG